MNNHKDIPPDYIKRAAERRQLELRNERKARWINEQQELETDEPRHTAGVRLVATIILLTFCAYIALAHFWFKYFTER